MQNKFESECIGPSWALRFCSLVPHICRNDATAKARDVVDSRASRDTCVSSVHVGVDHWKLVLVSEDARVTDAVLVVSRS